MLASLKSWLYAAGAAVIAVLLLLVRIFSGKAKRAERRADVAEEGLKRRAETEDRESEIDREYSDLKRETDLDQVPEHLRNPRRRR